MIAGGAGLARAKYVTDPFNWSTGQISTTDYGAWSLDVADADNDRDLDVAAAMPYANTMAVFESRGGSKPAFVRHLLTDKASGGGTVKFADIDGDGVREILATKTGSGEVVYFDLANTATLAYAEKLISSDETGPMGIGAADLDRDGDVDVAVSKGGGANVIWFENLGTAPPTFTRHVIDWGPSGAGSLAVGDVNRDGRVDILVSSIAENKINLYLNFGNWFSRQVITSTLKGATNVGVADFDKDGRLDVYGFGHQEDELDVFMNNGAFVPAFTKNVIWFGYTLGGFIISAGDVDNDGQIDLVTNKRWFRNTGGGTFQAIPIYNHEYSASSIALGRIDPDAYPDLIAGEGGGIYWHKNVYLNPAHYRPAKRYPESGLREGIGSPRLGVHDTSYFYPVKRDGAQWQVSATSDFSNIVYDVVTAEQLQVILPPNRLSLDKPYFWRARWRFGDAWSQWSNTASFWTVKEKIRVSGTTTRFATIQGAIDAAAPGATVIVPYAEYVENIDFKGKNIRLQSQNPDSTKTVTTTVIDGNGKSPTVRFAGSEGTTCSLAGFTIRNGLRGVYGNSCRALIEKNLITGNTPGISHVAGNIRYNRFIKNTSRPDYYSYGNPSAMFYCNGVIENNYFAQNSRVVAKGCVLGQMRDNVFVDNDGDVLVECYNVHDNRIENNEGLGLGLCINVHDNEIVGNAVGLQNCDNVHDNLIAGNKNTSWGGGLAICTNIYRNIIMGNQGQYGGGLYRCSGVHDNLIVENKAYMGGGAADCSDFYNNTIVKNTATRSGGGVYDSPVVDCIVWSNEAPTDPQISSAQAMYSCIAGVGAGNGNIAADPQFVDAAAGDWRLKETSPCIDAGMKTNSTTDLLGVARGLLFVGGRGDGSNYDMGAYEFQPTHFEVGNIDPTGE